MRAIVGMTGPSDERLELSLQMMTTTSWNGKVKIVRSLAFEPVGDSGPLNVMFTIEREKPAGSMRGTL